MFVLKKSSMMKILFLSFFCLNLQAEVTCVKKTTSQTEEKVDAKSAITDPIEDGESAKAYASAQGSSKEELIFKGELRTCTACKPPYVVCKNN